MLETALQKEVVTAVNEGGGFAFKLQNRFIIGVPDLLVKLRKFPPTLFEVKVDKLPVKAPSVVVALTPMQLRFLQRADDAELEGCGVISFLQRGPLLAMLVIPIKRFDTCALSCSVASYMRGPLKDRRSLISIALFDYFHETWSPDDHG